jgi:hypothetical protein
MDRGKVASPQTTPASNPAVRRSSGPPWIHDGATLLDLQRSAGNRAVSALVATSKSNGSTARNSKEPGGLLPPIQRLMSSAAFIRGYPAQIEGGAALMLAGLLEEYHSTWGISIGPYEYLGKERRQKRIQLLSEMQHEIHRHFRDSAAQEIKDSPESKLLLLLLDEIQEEHEKQIQRLSEESDELPIDERGLSSVEKAEVLQLWQSIVTGTGNLKITEEQVSHVTLPPTKRQHAGFRSKALSSLARLLQHKQGRKLIREANRGGSDPSMHITIAPSSKTASPPDKWGGVTFAAGSWEASGIDPSKGSPQKTGDEDEELTDLPDSPDALAAYEKAVRSKATGVQLPDGTRYRFGPGTGSLVSYIKEHKDSENRVLATTKREGLSPTFIALGHELGHALRLRRGASVSGGAAPGGFLEKSHGVTSTRKKGLWTEPEELLNIKLVENKLLVENDLAPRLYHKDYAEYQQS